jgi:uncharacterized cupin superfamily protein
MVKFTHVRAEAVAGPLEPRGQRPGADDGDPQIASRAFETVSDVKVGLWESQPGGWPVESRADTETCYILQGRARITDGATGETFDVTAGDVIVQPRGWSGRWDVLEPIRKVYSIGVLPADPA